MTARVLKPAIECFFRLASTFLPSTPHRRRNKPSTQGLGIGVINVLRSYDQRSSHVR